MANDRYQLRAVTRALDLLITLQELERPVELTAIARAVGLNPTTALRHLESLRSRGFVTAAPRGGYDLGSRLFELGNAYMRGTSIWGQANDLARRLAESLNETASVGVLDEGQVLYIAIANGQRELGIQSVAGTRHPLHCTALGKALLSGMDWPKVMEVLGHRQLQALTGHTITDVTMLRQELAATAIRGFSIDDEERHEGVYCLGAPIRDFSGATVAALSVSGPKFRMQSAGTEALAKVVMNMADEASRRLGDVN